LNYPPSDARRGMRLNSEGGGRAQGLAKALSDLCRKCR
jgi:hypothetical protein